MLSARTSTAKNGLAPSSFCAPICSGSDGGNFHEQAIKGKTVIIGAMAAELGDQLPVPVHGILSGPLVHALAFESLVQGRDTYGKSALFIVIVAFLLSYSAGRLSGKLSWRLGPRTPGV